MEKKIPVYHSIEEVFAKLEPTYGHTFKEYDVNHRLDQPNNKGQLGHIVEEGILGYPINSDPEADLAEIGVEVKTTGVITTKKKKEVRAKERLTIDSLNYTAIVDYDFEESPMWQKADDMLFVFYQYIKGVPYGDMPIIKAAINTFDEADVQIIKQDFDYILSMINDGRAEEISEGDTMYLGACTAGHGEMVEQPFSSVKAKKRKFCLKQSYFTQLVRKYISDSEMEHVISIDEIKEATFEMAMQANLSRYYGMSETEIREKFGFKDNPDAKNRYERYLAAMLGIKGKVSKTDEFLKAGIEVKTIRLKAKGKIKENMSFPYFEFTELVEQEWESSDLRDMFATMKYMFAIFQERDGEYYFDRIKFWHMTEQELDEWVKPVFEKTKKVLLSGKIVSRTYTNKAGKLIRLNYFPKKSQNPICHVRPHGDDAADTAKLPVPDKLTGLTDFTKQCFWLNNDFVVKIITEK